MASRRWFHPNISGIDAEQLLLDQGCDGSFLCRLSQSNPGDFTLSVRQKGHITHLKIQNAGDYVDFYGGEKYATLAELIQQFTDRGNKLREKNGEIIELKYALNCADPTNERWFHGSLFGFEAERILKAEKSDSYLVRESCSNPGDYVLSVRTGEKHVTHVMIAHSQNKFRIGGGEVFDSLTDLLEHYKRDPMVERSGNVVYLKRACNSTRVAASAIGIRMKAMYDDSNPDESNRDGFEQEFETLQQQDIKYLHTCKIGEKPENKSKNRYKDILPLDDSRVVLKDEDGGDYINANYIDLPKEYKETLKKKQVDRIIDASWEHQKVYIATQGCLTDTICDFWRMVWQENSRVIVMVTQEVEKEKPKCAKYWPGKGKKVKYNKITLISKDEKPFQDYTLREFLVLHDDYAEGQPREVFQYHFKSWPFHGVPREPSRVLEFLHDVNMRQQSIPGAGPVIVHCSEGIGRTGTLIVIDVILNLIKHHGLHCEIDISNTVRLVRSQRSGLVQKEAQYRFIYHAIRHYTESLSQRLRKEQCMLKTESHDISTSKAHRDLQSNYERVSTLPTSNNEQQVSKSACNTQGDEGIYQNTSSKGRRDIHQQPQKPAIPKAK